MLDEKDLRAIREMIQDSEQRMNASSGASLWRASASFQ